MVTGSYTRRPTEVKVKGRTAHSQGELVLRGWDMRGEVYLVSMISADAKFTKLRLISCFEGGT